MTPFTKKVIDIVRMVPSKRVVSYGQVALMAGLPRAARQVGRTLANLDESFYVGTDALPWWRVVNNAGRISIKGNRYGALEQKNLLQKEGILVNDNLTFDIDRYRWKPNISNLHNLQLSADTIDAYIEKYNL